MEIRGLSITSASLATINQQDKCYDCGNEFQSWSLAGFPGIRTLRCDRCAGIWEKARARELKSGPKSPISTDRWSEICPPLYAETDLEKLPDSNRETARKIQGWPNQERGILLVGPTASGKTRCLVKLMERLWFEGSNIKMFFGQQFGRECAKQFGARNGEPWMTGLINAEVVLLDDLGKLVLTDRTRGELFSLLDERMMYKRPVFVTSNSKGADLSKGLGSDIGDALVGRLRRFCECIAFQ